MNSFVVGIDLGEKESDACVLFHTVLDNSRKEL